MDLNCVTTVSYPRISTKILLFSFPKVLVEKDGKYCSELLCKLILGVSCCHFYLVYTFQVL